MEHNPTYAAPIQPPNAIDGGGGYSYTNLADNSALKTNKPEEFNLPARIDRSGIFLHPNEKEEKK